MAASYYVLNAEGHFVPQPLTIGPWDPRYQHGGPPAALLGRALERCGEDPASWFVSRITVDLMRPIPLAPLQVEVRARRRGRKVEWLEATLGHGEEVLATATGVRIRKRDLELPPVADEPPLPRGEEAFAFPFFQVPGAYHESVECRIARGDWPAQPIAMWIRPRQPLVAGEEMTSLQRVLVVADASNGIAPVLPLDRYVFINPDLTLHLHRPLQGPWVLIEAESRAEAEGVGMVDANLSDERGAIGRCVQSLMVAPRR